MALHQSCSGRGFREISEVIDGLSFELYTKEEIRDMSVVEITNPTSFDMLGHPTISGVYDSYLGPLDRGVECLTCRKPDIHCGGHFGHIELPLCVFNPLLFRVLYGLLSGTCLSCGQLTCNIDSPKSQTLIEKLRAYRNHELFPGASTDVGAPSTSADAQSGPDLRTRAIVDMRHSLCKAFLRDHLFKHVTKCPFCGGRNPKIRQEHCRQLLLHGGSVDTDDSPNKAPPAKKQKLDNSKSAVTPEPIPTGGDYSYLPDETDVQDFNLKHDAEMSFVDAFLDSKAKQNETATSATSKHPGAVAGGAPRPFSQMKVQQLLHKVWDHPGQRAFLSEIFPFLKTVDQRIKQRASLKASKESTDAESEHRLEPSVATDVFFFEYMPVSPSRFRPVAVMNGSKFDHPMSNHLKLVLEDSRIVRSCLAMINFTNQTRELEETDRMDCERLLATVPGATYMLKLQTAWARLQQHVNGYFDGDLDKMNPVQGLRQNWESKQGIFRKHMMGKRVNYAARSVISPDPYIDIDEIGIPDCFATKLTFPEAVTPWNIKRMRRAVLNGPDKHPGAVFVDCSSKRLFLKPNDFKQRLAVAKLLLRYDPGSLIEPRIVHRHLRDGDIMLMNRQPTLHKSSMMTHKARVLFGQKTIRLNYAVCKSYNADFDGDEMNAHYVQNLVAATEGYEVSNVSSQYLSTKDGSPLSGLIQDHVVSGVLLTIRDRFLTQTDYQQLVFRALGDHGYRYQLLPPAILKPVRRWTGKQVVSTLLLNLKPNRRSHESSWQTVERNIDWNAINLHGKAKTGVKNWQVDAETKLTVHPDMTDSDVVIRRGQLLQGVLDKAHYGAAGFSLVHACHELYGPATSCKLLSCLARLFTAFLQLHGFTLGVSDIVLTRKADKNRRKVMRKLAKCGEEAVVAAFGQGLPGESASSLIQQIRTDKKRNRVPELDHAVKQKTDEFTNAVNAAAVPYGLVRRFPENALQLMIESGAKGSLVNQIQISCELGQIELEGARVPATPSGRTAPAFAPYDPSPRAGGYIDGRFLSGIQPQEYFFHCMAGREGLIDTAVKTSRSGYLQRSIVKHLEGIRVEYDHTVRDSDQSIIQFRYGGDGLATEKVPYLKKRDFTFFADNEHVLTDEKALIRQVDAMREKDPSIARDYKRIVKYGKRYAVEGVKDAVSARLKTPLHPDKTGFCSFSVDMNSELADKTPTERQEVIRKEWYAKTKNLEMEERKELAKFRACPDPFLTHLSNSTCLGAVSEALYESVQQCEKELPARIHRRLSRMKTAKRTAFLETLKSLFFSRAMKGVAEPGEAIGVVAAQSIGEPSTQMTLNTFHFAGRGEMNVTLGIPRLREIFMVGTVKTPFVRCPIKRAVKDQTIKSIVARLSPVPLRSLLGRVELEEAMALTLQGSFRFYKVIFSVLPAERREDWLKFIPNDRIIHIIERTLLPKMSNKLRRQLDIQLPSATAKRSSSAKKAAADDENLPEIDFGPLNANSDDEDDDEKRKQAGAELDAGEARSWQRHLDEANEYVGEDEEAADPSTKNALDKEAEQEDVLQVQEEEQQAENEDEPDSTTDDLPTPSSAKALANDPARIRRVLETVPMCDSYEYDGVDAMWCAATMRLPARAVSVDVSRVVLDEVERTTVSSVPGVSGAMLGDFERETKRATTITIQGTAFSALFPFAAHLDVDKLFCNDIRAVTNTYGIEAGARTLVSECQSVFGAYGIDINERHLTLIADYMTQSGVYRCFNRIAMDQAPSFWQRMTFETTTNFMRGALLSGEHEPVLSPSACIVAGKVPQVGTGAFECFFKPAEVSKTKKRV